MNLSGVLPGDLVEIDKQGRVFIARVEGKAEEKDPFDLRVTPVTPNISYFQAKKGEVKHHWKLMGRPRGRPRKDGGTGTSAPAAATAARKRPGQKDEVISMARDGVTDAQLDQVQKTLARTRPRPGATAQTVEREPAVVNPDPAPRPRPRPGHTTVTQGQTTVDEQIAAVEGEKPAELAFKPLKRARPGTRAAATETAKPNPFIK